MFIVKNIQNNILYFTKLSNDILLFENKAYRFKVTNENRFIAVFSKNYNYGANFLGKYQILFEI